MEAIKNGKSVGKLFFEVNADTDKLASKCRTISKHLGALADDLERIDNDEDNDEDSEAKGCKIIDLLNELNDKDLEQIADYAQALFKHSRQRS